MPITRVLSKAQRLTRERMIIKDLRAGKLSYRKIAAKHKVSLPTVNTKARKAGISRSRSGPPALRKTTIRTTRPKARAATRGTRTVARRPLRKVIRKKTTTVRKPVARKKVVRKKVTRPVTRRRISATARTEKFQAQLQDLVLAHYPKISLKAFSRLSKRIVNSLG